MAKPSCIISIREHTKPVLSETAKRNNVSQIDLISRLVIGFAMLPELEQEAILMIGKRGDNLLGLGCTLENEGEWNVPQEIQELLG